MILLCDLPLPSTESAGCVNCRCPAAARTLWSVLQSARRLAASGVPLAPRVSGFGFRRVTVLFFLLFFLSRRLTVLFYIAVNWLVLY